MDELGTKEKAGIKILAKVAKFSQVQSWIHYKVGQPP
jgi:hypothetical protein